MVDKQDVRERVWRLLEAEGVARFPGARGRIPNFTGAEAAAERLAELPEWHAAEVVKSNPDAPQLPVRRRARREGKRLYMAVPRLRDGLAIHADHHLDVEARPPAVLAGLEAARPRLAGQAPTEPRREERLRRAGRCW